MQRTLLAMAALAAAGLQLGCASGDRGFAGTRSKPDMPPCQTNSDCRIAVYVSVGASQECIVQLLFDKITVAPVKTPKIVWRIEKADPDGDDYDYRFKYDPHTSPPTYGINIIGNDPSQDFYDPDLDSGNDKKFKWKSKHLRYASYDYTVNVERRPRHSSTWSDCQLLDPRIVNS